MIWQMLGANPHWGRRRIAMMMRLLGVFIAGSTVRNVLLRPRPRPAPWPAAGAQPVPAPLEPKQVVARYPGHVWSVDRTRVYLWGLWPTWVLVAIDHYSRKVMAVSRPVTDAADCVAALETAFREHGPPKHLICDQESLFTGEVFKELLGRWSVQHRLGAVGKQGSIAVSERVIWTLKREWLGRVAVIRGTDHLRALLEDFVDYYNQWRPHMTLGGATPEIIWLNKGWRTPDSSEKRIPPRRARQHDLRLLLGRPTPSPRAPFPLSRSPIPPNALSTPTGEQHTPPASRRMSRAPN